MDISLAPGGAAEPQGHVVQGGGQLHSVRCVRQGRAAGKPGQAHRVTTVSCLTCRGAGGCGARGQSVGAPADGDRSLHAGAVERATTTINCDVNKPVKSSLHSGKVKFLKSYCGFFNITQNNKFW